ncbi:MAG: phospholipase, partial [Rickettsiales bacterium]
CLIHGEADMVVPFDALAAAETALKAVDVPVETHARPHLGHGIDPEGMELAAAFLQQKLD